MHVGYQRLMQLGCRFLEDLLPVGFGFKDGPTDASIAEVDYIYCDGPVFNEILLRPFGG